MDDNNNNNKIISNDIKKNFLEENSFKKTKINEFLNSVKNNKNNKNKYNNTSLNRENKNYISQTNTLEYSKDYKNTNNESNMTSYILPSEKKESNNISKDHKINKKDKINYIKKKEKKLSLNNNYDLLSPRHIINNNKNISTPKTETKIKINNTFIKKKVEPLNYSSLENINTNKHFDSPKKRTIYKTFRNVTENNIMDNKNERLNNKKKTKKSLNHDNIRLLKMPETNNSNITIYKLNSKDKNIRINHDILIKTKKKKHLSLVRHKNATNKKNIYNSLNEDNFKKKTTNNNENKNRKNKSNNVLINLNDNKNDNIITPMKNNNKIIHFFSNDNIKTKNNNYEKDIDNIAKKINFNEIDKILNFNIH